MKKICFLAACCLAMCLSAYSIDRGTEKGHEWVDLGLPSGTKWATCNVGASNPQEYGNYYAWGEVTPKDVYNWSTYKYGSNYDQLTRYNTDSVVGKNGFADGKTVLELEDDAAHVNWGGKWRMPTREQQDELCEQCYWVWTENYNNSGVKGYIVYKAKASSDKDVKVFKDIPPLSSYSLSDAHIFLPAAGVRGDGDLSSAGSYGCYWSSSLHTGTPNSAWDVLFLSVYVYYDYYDSVYRCYGLSVRAVIPGD
ncbi:MAG: hypothetical protein IJP79_06805 [Paludibacteraceae bacterium]|nr:hypothetical protein [Paludibacteraceae bacterium]MBQ6963393.1 hypothetical protein [Paludibacteraceae bacterium]